ncbi:MAG TPA: hypothetical protein VK612_00190 [Pyrinomonadaceae bacterium]|nr:hypothetical protein [Pyrinomonadaceae bacterium]
MLLFGGVDLIQTQSLPITDLWYFLPVGYLLTILIETPVLLAGLSSKLTFRQKLLCGIWLTACTYPIVVLVLPTIFFGSPRWQYLAVAETFAPVGECVIFWLAFRGGQLLEAPDWWKCFVAIVIANLASFGVGEIFNNYNWFGLF